MSKKEELMKRIRNLMKEEVFSVTDAEGQKIYFYYDASEKKLYVKSIRGNRVEVQNVEETFFAIINGKEYHQMYLEDLDTHRTSIMSVHRWKLDLD